MLEGLEVQNFRCIERAQLEFDCGGTGILGTNASGKTSLLEAIYLMGYGRSFRTSIRDSLVHDKADFFRIMAKISSSHGSMVAGAEYSEGKLRAKLAGRDVSSISDIAEILPIQLIDPGIHRLIEEGSARRRRALDWGVFHVKPQFLPTWRRYQKALQQRNATLRSTQDRTLLRAWEQELISCGCQVDEARFQYVAMLCPTVERITSELFQLHISVVYRRGWPLDQTFEEAIQHSRARDHQLRLTTMGPHRADLSFKINGLAARNRISRGQQKMLAASLVLAQIELRARSAVVPTCLLLDDPAAELDVDNLGKLLRVIDKIPSQLVVTSLNEAGLKGMRIRRVFHVERGNFRAVL